MASLSIDEIRYRLQSNKYLTTLVENDQKLFRGLELLVRTGQLEEARGLIRAKQLHLYSLQDDLSNEFDRLSMLENEYDTYQDAMSVMSFLEGTGSFSDD